MSAAPTFPSLHLCHDSFSDPSVTLPTSQLILKPFRQFTYVTTHSPTLPSLYLRHSSFSNPSLLHLRHSSFSNPPFASPTSQALHLIQLVSSAHSPNFPSLHLRHNSFSDPSVTLPTSQLILQTLLLLYLYHSSFSNPSVASPTLQIILQPFFHFSYVTSSSLNSPGEPPMRIRIVFFTFRK